MATADPASTPGPGRDFIVSPSDLPAVLARIEQENVAREKVGLPRMTVDVSRQHAPVEGDDIMSWERATIRVSGASEEELARLNVGNVHTEPERKVKTFAVLEAAAAATRLNGGVYAPRSMGEHSTPAQVNAFIADRPGGPVRTRLATTREDYMMARKVRGWVRMQQPTSDYVQALRHSVAEDHMSLRESGTAASAVAGYLQHQQRADQISEQDRQHPAAVVSPRPSGSRWLGQPGEKYTLSAHVERKVPVQNPSAPTQERTLYIMRTPDGDLLRWLAHSNDWLREGNDVTFHGTVKAHSTFNGERQTEVYYCKDFAIHNDVPKEQKQKSPDEQERWRRVEEIRATYAEDERQE